MESTTDALPIINISPLFGDNEDKKLAVAKEIGYACRNYGFFYVAGHPIPESLIENLQDVSQAFFDLPIDEKMKIKMNQSGTSCKGYMPFGEEITSGKHDQKEVIYFGEELDHNDSRVQRGLLLHGPNQFPTNPSTMKSIVLSYIEASIKTCQTIMEGIALSLGLESSYFYKMYTSQPTVQMSAVYYVPGSSVEVDSDSPKWGVHEHTDYGLLILLAQSASDGLEVKTPHSGWIRAPPIPGTLICNLGDMLDKLTRGIYRSTLHRARVPSKPRLSFPLFFDPSFDSQIVPLHTSTLMNLLQDKENGSMNGNGIPPEDDKNTRWNEQSVHEYAGKYGDYLIMKLGKALPFVGIMAKENS